MDLPITLGQVIANKYRVDRLIGTGGMGVVFAGVHLELDGPVAIKFLSTGSGLQHEAGVRFRREAQAAAKIHSEHVVRVFDVGLLDDSLPYLVMELLVGNDLEQELEARGPLPVNEVLSYVVQAIDAVAEAHAVGIVHRDLKPTNLYLTQRSDGTRLVKVLDFGISKSISPGPRDVALTRTSAFVGSPLFMSPEQMRSARDVDSRTDIWSLGVILYVLLTGKLPYTGESLPELCVAVLNQSPRPLLELQPGAPPELERILLKCLEKERTDRYATVAELAFDLVQLVPEMRGYAERAARVLTRSHVSKVVEEPRRISLPSATPNGTQASWNKTGGKPPLKRRLPVLVSAVLGAGAVVVGLLYSGLVTPEDRSPLPSASAPGIRASAPAIRANVAASEPITVPKPREQAPPPAATAPAIASAPSAAVPEAPAPSKDAVRAEPPRVSPTRKAKPVPATPPANANLPATPAQEKTGDAPAASAIPYFGGRR